MSDVKFQNKVSLLSLVVSALSLLAALWASYEAYSTRAFTSKRECFADAANYSQGMRDTYYDLILAIGLYENSGKVEQKRLANDAAEKVISKHQSLISRLKGPKCDVTDLTRRRDTVSEAIRSLNDGIAVDTSTLLIDRTFVMNAFASVEACCGDL